MCLPLPGCSDEAKDSALKDESSTCLKKPYIFAVTTADSRFELKREVCIQIPKIKYLTLSSLNISLTHKWTKSHLQLSPILLDIKIKN